MKKGGRQSNNIEDIRTEPGMTYLFTPESKTEYPEGYMKMTGSRKLIDKGGMLKMDAAARRDKVKPKQLDEIWTPKEFKK